ncbi:hypothetical protein DNTS_030060 [Danionella cerebrum]|uniref:ZP-C domain-containing protein n=1 Tax=Danionella cerebrum TaxID=2873325 RepID=A0A553NJ74_9TELE|nr:hypothetical protein DNTS_030060 [Danionella translucida]TRY65469.1 hypothetical protein DNTS_030060 [Danionella translucida]
MAPSVRPEEALRLHAALAPAPAPAPPWLLEARAAPLLSMELFVTDAFEKRAVGPCVISAQERLYVQIMVVSAALEAVELQSCVVSPLSGPQAHRGWSIIKDSCPADASFALLSLGRNIQRDEEDPEKPEHVQDPRSERWRNHGDEALRGLPESFRSGNLGEAHQDGAEAPDGESLNPLRFSFVLQPVFNNSIQFLHCRLRVCSGGEGRAGAPACADGTRVPPLTLTAASTQCEDRNLSRPVLVTSPAGFLAPPAGKLAQKPAEMSRQTPSPADEAPVLLLVFGAFLMGLSLMGALWCIYTHTGRRDLSQSETMEVEAMGNSRTQMEQTSSFHEGN